MSRRFTFLNDSYLAAQESELTAERIAQVESVLRIISESIEKLKISFVLPKIFENPITMRQYLGGTEYEECVTILEDYLRDKKAHTAYEPHSNFRLIKIIDMFQENYKMIAVLPDWFDDLAEDDKDLLEAFHLLFRITEARLKKSAISELVKEKTIHQIYHENERVKKNILDFQNKLRNQKINLRWKLAAKDGIIQKYEEDLAIKKWDNNFKIKQEIVKSSRQIRNIHNASVLRQKELEEELEKTKANYEKLLKQNLHQEKDARDEKNKLLIQLQTLVRKYDQNIGDKIRENMYLQEQYDELKKQFDEFLIEYQREEAEYEAIMTQKEEEERRKFEEKLMLFMMNRAARIIQRYWRRYRKEKKKKAKKGKGGKAKGKKK